jgi:hypothetical protein
MIRSLVRQDVTAAAAPAPFDTDTFSAADTTAKARAGVSGDS